MSFKKILASMLAVVAACGMSAAALTLDVAEAANETAVVNEAVLETENTITVSGVIEITADTSYENTVFVRADGYKGAFFNVSGGTLTLKNCVVDAGAKWSLKDGYIDNAVATIEAGGKVTDLLADTVDTAEGNVASTESLFVITGSGNLVLSETTVENLYSTNAVHVIYVTSSENNNVLLDGAVIRNVAVQAQASVLAAGSAGEDVVTFKNGTKIYNNIGTDPGAIMSFGGGALSEEGYNVGGTTFVVEADGLDFYNNIGLDGSVIMIRRANFNMNGGNIHDNYCLYVGKNSSLSPLYIHDGTDFSMNGGEISANYGFFGSAVIVREKSAADFEGGLIGEPKPSTKVEAAVVSNSSVTVDEDVVINGGVYVTNIAPLENNGTINGGLIALGDVVNNGTINGNIILAGLDVNFENNGTVTDDIKYVGAVAVMNGKKYPSLADAVSAAVPGDVITMLADATVDATVVVDKNVTIDGNAYTLKSVDTMGRNYVTPVKVTNGAEVTFKNIKIVGGNSVNENGAVAEGYAASAIEVDNATVNVADSELVGGDSYNGSTPDMAGSAIEAINSATVIVTDSTLSNGKCYECPSPVVTIDNTSTLSVNNVVFNYNPSKTGNPYWTSEVAVVDGVEGETHTMPVEMSGTISVFGRTLDSINIEIPEGADIDFRGDIGAEYVSNTLEVLFVKKDIDASGDTDEEADLYDIVIHGNAQFINRLTTADLTFKLDSDTAVKPVYEIIPVAPVKVTTNSDYANRYMFSFDGVTQPDETANDIVIAQVKFTGYGAYKFYVDAAFNETNVVHATESADSIVEEFTVDGVIENGEGKLVIDAKAEAVIEVPTRDLVINVDFPNAVNKNEADYQDMTVTVSGGDLKAAVVVELGKDNLDVAIDTEYEKSGAKYTAEVADGYKVTLIDVLTVNTTYNVTVEGAGYRTARYAVTMTDDKELNFWNNVKDNAVEVEEDKATSAVTKNFLAGDIVGDNQINIYDLSAVVSYFATDVKASGEYDKYVKYDLNRDGMIDSKDVAYVLVSWGA